MNLNNRNDDDNRMKEQGSYEYRDPSYNSKDDGRYVYKDDYENDKSFGLKLLPVLMVLIAALAVFLIINRGEDFSEPKPEPVSINELEETIEDIPSEGVVTAGETETTENEVLRSSALKNKPHGNLVPYGAQDGATVTAYSSWVQVTDPVGIADFYASEDVNVEPIMMALESEYARFVYEKSDVTNYRAELDSFLAEMESRAAAEGVDSVIQFLETNGYSVMEIAYIGEYLRGVELSGEDLDRLLIEYSTQEWLYSEAEEVETFEYVTTFDVVINGKTAPVYDYIYHATGDQTDSIRTYETSFIQGDNICRLLAWGWENPFMLNTEEYINMFESFVPANM